VVSQVATTYADAWDEDVASVLGVLKEYSTSAAGAYSQVRDAIGQVSDARAKLLLVNREECQVMAQRCGIIKETPMTLKKKYEGKAASSSSSVTSKSALPRDIDCYVLEVNSCLESVTKLICANIMPAKVGFFAGNQWLIKQALKRDEVRAEFSAQSAKLDSALHRLGVGAVIAGLPSVDACSGAITRSDLQEFQQQYAEEIQADAAQ
jgi:hypothetical protein